MSEQDTEGAAHIPIDQDEPADGVKVGGGGNYFPWLEPEPEPVMDDPSGPGLFPWAGFVWLVLAAMVVAAVVSMVAGR